MNSAFLQDTIANIMAANLSHAINGYVAFGPPECKAFFDGILPFSIQQLEAWYPNFGDCLFSAIDQVLNRGHHGAVVLNSDSPTLPTSLLVETARVLARPGDRVVLGPSVDGGYYLLGLKERHRRLFEDVMWSTEQVARQTLERAAQVGIEVHVLPTWYDVDEVAALNILLSELCDGGSFSPTLKPYEAPSSKHLVCSLLKDTDLPSRLERKRDRSKQMVMP